MLESNWVGQPGGADKVARCKGEAVSWIVPGSPNTAMRGAVLVVAKDAQIFYNH